MDSYDELTESEKDCIEYITGYVASRYATEYPWLSQEGVSSSWLQHVSRGNLTTPSTILLKCAMLLEKLFNDFHGKNINKEPKVMTRVSNYLLNEIKKENLNIPLKVVQCLVRTRTFIRLNYLNKCISSLSVTQKKENSRKVQKFI